MSAETRGIGAAFVAIIPREMPAALNSHASHALPRHHWLRDMLRTGATKRAHIVQVHRRGDHLHTAIRHCKLSALCHLHSDAQRRSMQNTLCEGLAILPFTITIALPSK